MPAPATIADFLDVARKSRQVEDDRLDAYLRQCGPNLPAEPRRLAGKMIRDGLLTVFQAEQFLLGKYKGFVLGNYRFLERLGIGGTGAVYLAEHQVMKRRVAVKVLPAELGADPVILERFRREARATAGLNHPNIVHVYDLCQDGDIHYIVMEYIDGPDLQRVVEKRGPFDVAIACNYVRQAALGLQHAHEAGVVHRDVKPGNLLVDANGVIKILDLGLVRVESPDEASVTCEFNNGQVLGTADYLAPEQALSLHDVDGRADVYALGATFYTLLTGQPPFHAGSVGQKLLWHQTQEPEPVDAVRPDVPAEVAAVVRRMLAKKPAERFQTMTEVAEGLAPWAEQAAGVAVTLGPRSRAELRLRPGTGALRCQTTRRGTPSRVAVETVVTRPKAATVQVRLPQPSEPPAPEPAGVAATPGNPRGVTRRVLLGGLCAAVVGLVGGAVALLLWGPG